MTDITVVIPTRGEPRYLSEAVASLRDADVELIVVEDGTRLVDEAMLGGGRLLRLPYVGRSMARNAGVAAARTPFVAFLDADDIALPGRFERQHDALLAAPGAALTFGRIDAFGGDGTVLTAETLREHARFDALLERGLSFESLLIDCPIYTSATMARRDGFLAAGGYDRLLDAYEDLDLYLRIARTAGLVATPGTAVSRHRRHPGNTPSDELYAGALRVTEKHLSDAEPAERRLLLERRIDSLWGLGDHRRARRDALAALRTDPALLRHRRFAKRLAASLFPVSYLNRRSGR